MYRVKTRNWNGNKVVATILNACATATGTTCYKSEGDFDHKYYLETRSGLRAWVVWGVFMLIRPFSGGWTYIACGNAAPDFEYKAIYR